MVSQIDYDLLKKLWEEEIKKLEIAQKEKMKQKEMAEQWERHKNAVENRWREDDERNTAHWEWIKVKTEKQIQLLNNIASCIERIENFLRTKTGIDHAETESD